MHRNLMSLVDEKNQTVTILDVSSVLKVELQRLGVNNEWVVSFFLTHGVTHVVTTQTRESADRLLKVYQDSRTDRTVNHD